MAVGLVLVGWLAACQTTGGGSARSPATRGSASELVFAPGAADGSAAGIAGRRDASLAVAADRRATALDDWRDIDRPNLRREDRIYFPRSAESYLYFRRGERGAPGHDYFRRRY